MASRRNPALEVGVLFGIAAGLLLLAHFTGLNAWAVTRFCGAEPALIDSNYILWADCRMDVSNARFAIVTVLTVALSFIVLPRLRDRSSETS